jgi:hypothetical protein
MPTRPKTSNLALLLTFLVVASVAACARTDAGEPQGDQRPEAGSPESSASAQPGGTPATAASTPSTPGSRTPASSPTAAPAGAEEAPAEAAAALVVAEGTLMAFTVSQTISTDKQKAGDRFTATLVDPVLDAAGAEILAAGTVGQWVITESTEKNAEGQAVLAVALEMLDVGGDWHPVVATVTDLALKTDNPDSKTESAAKIGIGAAAGALAGRILGGSRDATLKGAGAGAAVGTVVALATRGGSAAIQQGSRITVSLDQQLALPPR